jgi:N-acyl homoserine lactone hydrolase
MKIEMFNVGWVSSATAIWRQGADPESTIRFPVPAYLIETDTERILIDTGLNPRAARDAEGHYDGMSLFELEQDLDVAAQVDVSTLTRVVLTHLHFDHAGSSARPPASVPIFVQREEWRAGHDDVAVARNFLQPRDYALEDREIVLVDGDHDLLGDGSIQLLSTPGHTPGHQSVRVGERLVIGADVTHFEATLDDRRFPSFADDFDAQARSAERLRVLRDTGSRVLPGHDPDVLVPGPLAL